MSVKAEEHTVPIQYKSPRPLFYSEREVFFFWKYEEKNVKNKTLLALLADFEPIHTGDMN
jgi:hypothetical protein